MKGDTAWGLENCLRAVDTELQARRAEHVALVAEIDRLEHRRNVVVELLEKHQ